MRRVAITGLGLVSSLGHDVESFWNATRNGETGVAPTTIPEGDSLTARMVAEVKGWDGAKALDRKLLGLSDRFSQFAVYAAKQAVDDAGDMARGNAAIIIGTGVGGAVTLDESYVRLYRENQQRIHPFSIPRLMANGSCQLGQLGNGHYWPVVCRLQRMLLIQPCNWFGSRHGPAR